MTPEIAVNWTDEGWYYTITHDDGNGVTSIISPLLSLNDLGDHLTTTIRNLDLGQ